MRASHRRYGPHRDRGRSGGAGRFCPVQMYKLPPSSPEGWRPSCQIPYIPQKTGTHLNRPAPAKPETTLEMPSCHQATTGLRLAIHDRLSVTDGEVAALVAECSNM